MLALLFALLVALACTEILPQLVLMGLLFIGSLQQLALLTESKLKVVTFDLLG
jgi:hypothetical protein